MRLIGDVPIYVARAAASTTAPTPSSSSEGVVAGAPPDALGPDGQLWGNPLFDWHALAARRVPLVDRALRRTFELFDLTRIDHFRGFVSYWAVPGAREDGREGRWQPGPGAAVFRAARGRARAAAGDRRGPRPDHARRSSALRDELGFPGMRRAPLGLRPAQAATRTGSRTTASTRVVYTSTHDTDTLAGRLPASANGSIRRAASS